MVMTIKVANSKFLFFLITCLFALALETSSSFSRELDKVSIDYNVVIRESLKRNGTLLDLSGKKIGDQGLKFLIDNNILKNIEKIDLRYNEITAIGAELFAKQSPLLKLRSLILRHNFLGDKGAASLARSNSFPNLEEIELGWTETRDAGAMAFGNTHHFKSLRKLDLRGNFLANRTKEALRKSLGHLKSLKLY
jgi:Ran GTPase-activating protein (RanGAP) involved in mRNA processing and transport